MILGNGLSKRIYFLKRFQDVRGKRGILKKLPDTRKIAVTMLESLLQ